MDCSRDVCLLEVRVQDSGLVERHLGEVGSQDRQAIWYRRNRGWRWRWRWRRDPALRLVVELEESASSEVGGKTGHYYDDSGGRRKRTRR